MLHSPRADPMFRVLRPRFATSSMPSCSTGFASPYKHTWRVLAAVFALTRLEGFASPYKHIRDEFIGKRDEFRIIHRSSICRDDLIQIGAALFRCSNTSWLPARSPSTASIVSCGAFAVSQSMLSCSTDVSLRHTSTIPRVFHSAHTTVAKPTFMYQAPLHRLQTTSYHTKIQISRLREILQGRYTTDPCHYCIVSVAAMHYC